MAVITLWHNPRCSKSRAALKLLEEAGVEVVVRRYLDDIPSEAELRDIARALDKSPADFIRRGEKLFKSLNLAGEGDDVLFDAMAANPILIERPIARHQNTAVIGRPPEDVLTLLT